MDELLARVAGDLAARLTGPLTLRLLLQPAVAILLAVRDGVADGRQHRPAFFWSILSDPAHRRDAVANGWKSIAKVFGFAFALDAVYQAIALHWFYPGEALFVAVLLAIVPYLLLRGPVNRLVGRARRAARGSVRS